MICRRDQLETLVPHAEPLVPLQSAHASEARGALGLLVADLGLSALAILSFTTLLAAQLWLPDMLSFFRPHLFYLSIAALAVALVFRGRGGWRLLVAGLIVVFNAWPLMVQTLPLPQMAPAGAPTIRIMSANLLRTNSRADLMRQAVAEVAPDILVVQEEDQPWRAAVATLDQLPYRSRFTGVDVASRFPMTVRGVGLDMQRLMYTMGGGTARRAEIDPGPAGPRFVLYGIHPPTPRTLEGWRVRAAYLAEIARLVAAEPAGTPVVVVGDWNTPTWSPVLRRFLEETQLATAEASPWPAATRIFDLFGVVLPRWLGSPIDRVAVSHGIAVANFRTGPAFGSDHLPVYANVVLPAKP